MEADWRSTALRPGSCCALDFDEEQGMRNILAGPLIFSNTYSFYSLFLSTRIFLASTSSFARYVPNHQSSVKLKHGTQDLHSLNSAALLYELIENLGMENSVFGHLMGTFRFERSKLIPFFSGFLEILGMDEGLDLPMLAQRGYIGAFFNMMISCLVLGIKKFPSEGVPNLQLDSLDSETFVDFMENCE